MESATEKTAPHPIVRWSTERLLGHAASWNGSPQVVHWIVVAASVARATRMLNGHLHDAFLYRPPLSGGSVPSGKLSSLSPAPVDVGLAVLTIGRRCMSTWRSSSVSVV